MTAAAERTPAERKPAATRRDRTLKEPRRRERFDAVTLLTVYLVLLYAIPSNVTIDALNSLGRPSLLWGVVLMVFWTLSRLQRHYGDPRPIRQPVRFAFALLFVIALVSFTAALLRGQPADQVSPAFTALVRLMSWAGVVLVAVDGIRTMTDFVRITRRIAIAAGLLAALGILQFLTKQTIVDFFNLVPGLSSSGGGVVERGGVTRASGTAIHPLEYATTLIGAFPIVIAAAISHGFRWHHSKVMLRWWAPVAAIVISALVGVSRSAIIGFFVAAVAMIPAIPRRYRAGVVAGAVLLIAVVVAALPGLLSTTVALFTGAGTDPSTQSRVGGLDRAPEFIGASPVFGVGFGTFLPRYYIFDNAWVLMTVELGILGVAAFAGVVVSSVWSALVARRQSGHDDVRLLGYSLAVSMLAMAIMFAFFDGLSFPISAGTLFLVAGLCGSLRNIGATDAWLNAGGRPRRDLAEGARDPAADDRELRAERPRATRGREPGASGSG
ncbi:O-antigen ligase family protein [Leifsonia shinshuensis]|uniref:O-antigen ligase family protein n=1 Tax=Leifsonia shinshuensis TaxID=150026 RepID=A0A7G6YDY0_9MICO|nr:O-antigen ligase family protein [Leifsonia shinshuensis]QNE36695.1 O-antigen ligase family protein [Leifsonia shinshuensis]